MAGKAKAKSEANAPAAPSLLTTLPPWDSGSRHLQVLIDTPKGSATKFKYDGEKGCYTISHILSPGAVFPFDFGSIPSTSAADGDPLDVMILMEAPSFPGCLVAARLLGVLEAKQTQEGKTNRNDRLIAVAAQSRAYRDYHAISDVPKHLLDEIERFFVAYNELRGRRFRVTGRYGIARAERLVREARTNFRKKGERDGSGGSR